MPTDRAPSVDRRVAITVLALVALALAATVVVRSGGGAASTSIASDLGDPVLGSDDAPVEVVEYSDFACPFCGQHAREVKPSIIEDYVETGVVRYVWRDLPLQGDRSQRAALAARAAQEQGLFWEYHDVLFADEGARLDDAGLREAAESVGLDLEAFDEALRTEAHLQVVQDGLEEAQDLGLTGTPAFTVNDERIVGAQPYEVFVEVIERAADAAE